MCAMSNEGKSYNRRRHPADVIAECKLCPKGLLPGSDRL